MGGELAAAAQAPGRAGAPPPSAQVTPSALRLILPSPSGATRYTARQPTWQQECGVAGTLPREGPAIQAPIYRDSLGAHLAALV